MHACLWKATHPDKEHITALNATREFAVDREIGPLENAGSGADIVQKGDWIHSIDGVHEEDEEDEEEQRRARDAKETIVYIITNGTNEGVINLLMHRQKSS